MNAEAMSSHSFRAASRGARQLPEPVAESQIAGSGRPSVAEHTARSSGDWVLLGESAAVRQLRSQVQRIAPYFRTALIRGESGSGRQAVAQALHARSPGAAGQFVVRDARALAEAVDRGRGGQRCFDGSPQATLERARGGTLHLTRVGELSFSQQAALFRFLRGCEERLARPETGSRIAPLSDRHQAEPGRETIRILAATDRDLRTLAAIGQFRQDLYARLSAVEICIPPLRERIEDVGVLAEWLVWRICEETGQGAKIFAEPALQQLQQREWPENLRELERVVARATALAEGRMIEARHLLVLVEAGRNAEAGSPVARIERLQDVVERHVLEVLTRCEGNKLRAAELLGISRSTLYRMLGSRAGPGKVLPE
jgi:DNA-binding NtrC family response regulator